MENYALFGMIMGIEVVFTGYVRCMLCKDARKQNHAHGECNKCKRRVFEYGVLHHGMFVSYIELKDRIHRGQKYIDGTHDGLSISCETFRIKNAVDKK